MRFGSTTLEDAAQDVLKKLVCAGPRGARPMDPTTDQGVSQYLRKALTNGAIDLLRRQRRFVPQPPDHPDPGPAPDEVREFAEVQRAVAAARSQLYDEIVPAVAAHMEPAAKDNFLGSLRELSEIAKGSRTFSSVVE